MAEDNYTKTISYLVPGVLTLSLALSLAGSLSAQTPPLDLTPIAPEDIPPAVHNYYSLQSAVRLPPMPFNWLSGEPDVLLYFSPSRPTNAIWVGDQNINYAQRAAEAQVLRLAIQAAENDGPPSPGGGTNSGGGGTGGGWSGPIWGTNDFYLEAVSVTNGLFNAILHNTTNGSTYLALSTGAFDPSGSNVWLTEGSFVGSESNATAFALGVGTRTNSLLLRAQACDECAVNVLPLWWQLEHFGVTGVDPYGNWDGDTANNLAEYVAGTDPNSLSFAINLGFQAFSSCQATGQFEVLGGVPAYSAVVVNQTNLSSAVWTPYSGLATFTLGPTDGVYSVQFGLKGRASASEAVWHGTTVVLDRAAPAVRITTPVGTTATKPVIQVKGYCPEPLWSVTYSISNAAGVSSSLDGMLVLGYDDPTNAFQLFDVQLANGLNLLTLTVQDTAGNLGVTNLQYMLDYSNVTNSPALQVFWPQDRALVSGTNFTLRGHVDDETAGIILEACGPSGETNTLGGLVERDGAVWVEDVPLETGTNFLRLTATSAAGLSNTITLAVIQSDVTLTIDDVPDDQLSLRNVAVTGTISDTSYKVWVNGLPADLTGNNWAATNVPVTAGGTAIFSAIAIPLSDHGGNGTPPSGQGTDPSASNPSSSSAPSASFQPEKQPEVTRVYGDWSGQGSDSFLTNPATGSFQASWFRTETNGGAEVTAGGSGPGPGSSLGGVHYSEGLWGQLWQNWEDDPTNVVYSTTEQTPDLGLLIRGGIFYWSTFEPMANWVRGATSSSGATRTATETIVGQVSEAASHTRVVLRTRGRSGVARQNLFVVTGAAWDKTKPGPPQLPSQQLWVPGLNKYLGSDGRAYAVLPDNAEINVTLGAPAPYYRFVVSATKYKLHVVVNGTVPLAPDKAVPLANYCVGQQLNFSPVWKPEMPPGISTNGVQWTLGGNYVNDSWQLWNADPDFPSYHIYYGSLNYTNNPLLLTNENTHAWWVSGGYSPPATLTASLRETLSFANGQTAQVFRNGLFAMNEPKVLSLVTRTNVSILLDTNSSMIYLGLAGRETWETGEMDWNVSFKVPGAERFRGTAAYTQLLQTALGYDVTPLGIWFSESTGGAYWLDNRELYITNGIVNSSRTIQDIRFLDCPGVSAHFHSLVEEFDVFKTYLRYKPDSDGAIYVTLGRIDWGWHGKAEGVPWSLSVSNIISPTLDTSDRSFPKWEQTYYNTGPTEE